MPKSKDPAQIEKDLELDRWADQIYPTKGEFLKRACAERLVFYHGIDPTGSALHLGHSTNLFFLKKLHEAGHKIIILIGSFTAQIGDPTGKSSTRKPLTKKEVLTNAKTYKKQISKILNLNSFSNPIQIKFNSDWLAKLSLEDVIKIMANVTHGQMIKRSMFQERLKNGQEIYFHEFMYPLLQGYDSVAMNVDGEVGGTDQTFNMLVGRDLLKIYKNKEKFVVTTPLLENPKTGKKLMSKSEGNYVALNDLPKEMYGKIMAMPDEVIIPCFKYCTEIETSEIKKMEESLLSQSVNPRDLKAKLAKEITKIYHGEKSANDAEKEFENVFRSDKLPEEIVEIKIEEQKMQALDLLVKLNLATSKGEAKRLVIQKGVKMDGIVLEDWQKEIEIKKGTVFQVGKRKFAKIS